MPVMTAPPVTPPALDATAQQAMDEALDFCRKRLAPGADTRALLHEGSENAHDYFRYALAGWLGRHLGQFDPTVKAVFVCPVDGPGGAACRTMPLSVVVRVDRKTAALDSLLAGIDASLTRGYRDLLAPHVDTLASLVDAHLVDDEDVARGTGLAVLLASLHQRPTRAWAR